MLLSLGTRAHILRYDTPNSCRVNTNCFGPGTKDLRGLSTPPKVDLACPPPPKRKNRPSAISYTCAHPMTITLIGLWS